MTKLLLEKKLINKKFGDFFKQINKVYHSPKSTKKLVNKVIANKIALQFNTKTGYVFKERDMISYELSFINFTTFYKSTISKSEDNKIYFMLKHPEKTLKTTNLPDNKFIDFSLKKFCNEFSSQKLYDIYRIDLNKNLYPVENKLKNVIYEIVSVRCKLINRIASIFESTNSKNEIDTALKLKRLIESTNFKIKQYPKLNQDKTSLFSVMKSVI